MRRSGESTASGSTMKTSSAAPAIRPWASASIKAAWSVMAARAVAAVDDGYPAQRPELGQIRGVATRGGPVLRALAALGVGYSLLAIQRTGHQPGHYTIWGEPVELLRCVVSVAPV